jgi:hypothetical protein
MSGLWAPFAVFPLTASGLKRYRTSLYLYEVAHRYLDEMIRCNANEAHTASGIVGCSMVEAVLMLACVRDRDSVLHTAGWKIFAKKEKRRGDRFSELLPWIDFGHLMAIGKELGWFSADQSVTERFLHHYSIDDEILKDIPKLLSSPWDAATQLHELRNYLHPGKCLRHRVNFDEKTAKLSAGLAYICLMGVLDYYKGEDVDHLDLEVPPTVRKALAWSTLVEQPNIEPSDSVILSSNIL